MQLTGLLALLRQSPLYRALFEALQKGGSRLPDQRVLRAARPYVAAALARDLNRPVLIVTASVERAYNTAEQLPVWLPETPILRFAEPSAIFYERSPWATNTIRARVSALAALCPPPGMQIADLNPANPTPPVIVTSALALMQRTLPVREFRAGSRLLKRGQRIEEDKLLRTWLGIGYTPTTIVTEPGMFSRRGGIIDVFPINAQQAARIEFFGDEIESLRTFDPATQRSTGTLDQLIVVPAREALPKYGGAVAQKLAEWFATQPDLIEDVSSARPDQNDLASESAFPTLEFYLPFFYSTPAGLLDYLPKDALVIVEDWDALQDSVGELEAQAVGLREEKRRANGNGNTNQLPAQYPLPYFTWEELRDSLTARRPLHLGGGVDGFSDASDSVEASESDDSGEYGDVLGTLFAPGPRYGGQLRAFMEALWRLKQAGERPIIVSNQAQRLAELWAEEDRNVVPVTRLGALPEGIAFVEGTLAEGFTLKLSSSALPNAHTPLFTDSEIFGWKRPEPRRHTTPRAVSPEAYFADMAAGDYVVHIEYGIGRFVGLQKRVLDGSEREYLVLQYSGSDTLYVPIHQADRLSRYVGPDDRDPQLSRLGSGDWAQHKETARRAAEEIAKELLALYARRAAVEGYAFSPDSTWQAELEASFPYIETDDQLSVLADVKADMERPNPMDRLICGDVGYGKTEVALRAAFKAVMDGKQVAVLVPTTVLAQQHFNTFSQRLTAFPVRVDMLSRFRSPREQRQTLAQALSGEVDILIGTHRILQDDVIFRDLGLLIIDEEQRFGVTHKERLKQMRAEVDVLTLTATPIPRTLYMSLAGIRDISMIQTPPAERLPVLTHVGSYDEKLIRQAILRELDRGGQVFFVHNRVSTIQTVYDHLAQLMPEARIAIGHGQMHEDELEEVMTRFAAGEFDVLLCTTIIESGLDIPNANTIIIDRADTFGLAQLYQLRGRVGRGAYRAYAYLFYPRGAHLTGDARARLDTIAEQTELGAGLSIAMRDLEIRGAGELLGMRQSGYIAAVGFHLYTQLLAREVQRLRAQENTGAKPATIPGTAVTDTTNMLFTISGPAITIDLPLPAYVSVDFMPQVPMRLQFYRRLAELHTLEAVDEIQAELTDRFGPLPPEVRGLLYQIRVKLLAQSANATAVTSDDNQIAVKLPYLAEVDRAALQRYLGNGARVSRTAVWMPRDEESPDAPGANEDWEKRLIAILTRLQPYARDVQSAIQQRAVSAS